MKLMFHSILVSSIFFMIKWLILVINHLQYPTFNHILEKELTVGFSKKNIYKNYIKVLKFDILNWNKIMKIQY